MVGTLGSSGLIGLAWVLLLICFFLMPPPTPDPGLTPVNINYVWGLSDNSAQPWVPPYVWFAGLLIGLPLLMFAPTHFVLARMMPATEQSRFVPLRSAVPSTKADEERRPQSEPRIRSVAVGNVCIGRVSIRRSNVMLTFLSESGSVVRLCADERLEESDAGGWEETRF
jgi:hypothetical protein